MKDAELAVYIRDHQGVTPASLSSYLGVSERTIRKYVRRLNDSLGSVAHISLKRGGYYLTSENWGAFSRWLSTDAKKWELVSSELPETSAERVAYITDDLLSRNDWITKDELAEMLYVSSNTISHDLAKVEKNLASFGLTLERRPHYGIRVVGGEMSRRLCLASAATERLLKGLDVDGDGSRGTLERVARCVDEVVKRDGFSMSALGYRNLLVHLTVALFRIKGGHYVPRGGEIPDISSSREFAVARDIALALEQTFSVKMPPEEVEYIAIHLASKRMMSSAPADEGVVISDEVWNVVSDMLERVNSSFHFDFRENLELRMNLARHIVPLSYRLTYNMSLKNPLVDEMKQRYPLAWSMAVESSVSLVEAYGRVPSDDEIGYLAMSFALALEREKTHEEGKSILIVCASGVGTAKLLKHLYEKEFGQWLSRVQTCDVAHLDEADLTGVDYVFTTVPLDKGLPVPVREVSAFLDDAEARDVRGILSGSTQKSSLLEYFDEELFFPHVPGRTRREVLDWMCDRREEYGGAGPNFRELVFKREEIVATTYGNHVAMPHPLEPVSERTLVSVGVTDEPIEWGPRHEVNVVFLLSVAKDNAPGRQLYDSLANLLVDEGAIDCLRRNRKWETLVELLGCTTRNQ